MKSTGDEKFMKPVFLSHSLKLAWSCVGVFVALISVFLCACCKVPAWLAEGRKGRNPRWGTLEGSCFRRTRRVRARSEASLWSWLSSGPCSFRGAHGKGTAASTRKYGYQGKQNPGRRTCNFKNVRERTVS